MNTMIRNRLLNTVVVILLFLNLIAMGIFWWQKWKDAPTNKPNAGASTFLIEKLQFDSTQLIAFKQLQENHQHQIAAAKDSMRIAKDRFFDLIDKETVTELDLKTATTNAAEMQIRLDRITFEYFKAVQGLCNADQKIKFKQIIREALRIMGRPGPPPPNRLGESERPELQRPDRPPPPDADPDPNRPPPPRNE
jgi:predicted negative regulator of RcsB-dependent stress response